VLELQQVISQIIAFLIMLWILKRFAWKPLLKILDDRRAKIREEFHEIDRQKAEVKKSQDDYENKLYKIEETRLETIHDAEKKAKEHTRALILDAQGQARGIINKALIDAEREASKVKDQLKNEMVSEAVQMTEKLIRKKLGAEEQKKLTLELLEEAKLNGQ